MAFLRACALALADSRQGLFFERISDLLAWVVVAFSSQLGNLMQVASSLKPVGGLLFTESYLKGLAAIVSHGLQRSFLDRELRECNSTFHGDRR